MLDFDDDWGAVLDANLTSTFLVTRAFLPALRTHPRAQIINVASIAGRQGTPMLTAYCAAKHALEGFSKSLALEGAAHGILSVTVTPGMYMHTPMSETTYSPEARAKWIDPIRLAPAFALLATRPLHLSGQRLDAWALSQTDSPA